MIFEESEVEIAAILNNKKVTDYAEFTSMFNVQASGPVGLTRENQGQPFVCKPCGCVGFSGGDGGVYINPLRALALPDQERVVCHVILWDISNNKSSSQQHLWFASTRTTFILS